MGLETHTFWNLYTKWLTSFGCESISRAHSPTLPSLHLRHSSLSNLSFALPTSQLILQSFRYFTHVTTHFQTLLSLFLRHMFFTYVTWRAAHDEHSRIKRLPKGRAMRCHGRTCYNKCHEWTPGWTPPMNKCTGRRMYAFPDQCVMVFFFHVVICSTTSYNIGHLCF